MVDFADITQLFENNSSAADAWRDTFASSDPAAHAESFRTFIDRDVISAACDHIDIEGDMRQAVLRAADEIARDPALMRLAWHCHYMLFVSEENQAVGPVYAWPKMPARGGLGARLLYAVVALSGFDAIRDAHAARDIPQDITWHTLTDVRIWIRDDTEAAQGTWTFNNIAWVSQSLQGCLYRLGRMQFEINTLKYPLIALRHKTTGTVTVLADEGETFRADGQFADADGCTATDDCFTTSIVERDGVMHGHVISPEGHAVREPTGFPLDEWDVALREGDPILYFHIPKDGRMDHTACGESFRASTEFFPRHFPEHEFKAYYTTSWLLDPQFDAHLDSASNIARFLREFHLLPRPKASDGQTMERVFGSKPSDWSTAPRDTSLRRAIADHAQNGGVWRDGAGLLLRDDLDWGAQVYRS